MATRYCMYCLCFREDAGFIFILHPSSGTKRGQCPPCQARRKKPRAELEQMAKNEAAARSARLSEMAKVAAERKLKNENTCDK